MSATTEPTFRMREVTFDPFAADGGAIAATAPATDAQREIWSATLFGKEASLAYNEANVLSLRGPLDARALDAALKELVARHEALRTTFSEDGAVLCVADAGHFEMAVADLASLTEADRKERYERFLADAVEVPFDLTRGPLFSARLVRFAPHDHALILAVHHIVCDGWSTRVLLEELAALYSAAKEGSAHGLPPAHRFTEYARHEAGPLAARARGEDREYWLEQLGRGVSPLELPTAGPRPPVRTYSSARLDFDLPGELVARVRHAGARHGCSLFGTLCASFAVFLGRLARQGEVVLGVPAAGQSTLEGQGSLVGHCVRTLPVRASFSADEPLSAVLVRQREVILDAFEHQACTFGTLLEHLPVRRDPSRLPFFSVLFNLDQAVPEHALRWDGIDVHFETVPRRFENFELFVNAVEQRGRVVLECQYNKDLFEGETLRHWLEGFAALLDDASRDTERPVGHLRIVGPSDLEALARLNATGAPYPRGAGVHELVEAQVDRTPHAPAVTDNAGTVTYAALDTRANRLARRLVACGLRAGQRVGIAVDRTVDMVAGMLAVLKAGAAYVPLDLAFPPERVAFVMADAGLEFIVTQKSLGGRLPEYRGTLVQVDDPALEAESPARPGITPAPNDAAAYVIYTSGSTGKPKGVEIPHRAVVNFLTSMAREPGLGPADVLLAVTTLSFDIAVLELLLPLAVGARVVVASRQAASDGGLLLSLIRAHGVTTIQATPSTWRLLLAAGWSRETRLKVLCGGEALTGSLARDLADRAAEVWNVYGPTETTVWSTLHRVGRPSPAARVPIGRPLANTQVHVLDERLQPVPTGIPGELCVGGDGLALGYVGRPDLTSERFIVYPSGSGRRVYRTGDVVRVRPDGVLEYLGRNDGQVKLRGHRIELAEVEAAIGTHPKVAQAAVRVHERAEGDAGLVAYVVPRDGGTSSDDLLAHARGWLPEYMVPHRVVSLAALPLTQNGKINRNALAAPSDEDAGVAPAYVEPRTATERLLADAWQDALGVGRLGARDDLFRLGAHSLLAAQVLSRLTRERGVALPLQRVFEAPTVAGLAQAWDDAVAKGRSPLAIVPRRDRVRALQSMMQQRIWFLEQMDPGLSVFNLPSAYRVKGRLDVDALERSLAAIIARHDSLRTALAFEAEVPVQVIADYVPASMAWIDLTSLPGEAREAEAFAAVQSQANVPFDLTRAPLFRASLYRLEEDDHLFFFMPHHAIWDGWSFDVFMRELDAHYGALVRGRTPTVPSLPIQYGDFAEWHRKWLQGDELGRQCTYWTARLEGGAPPLELPTDHPRPVRRTGRGSFEPFRLSADLATALVDVARAAGVTPYMFLLAAFFTLLRRRTAQDDLVVGTPVRGRSRPETEHLLGFFVNTLALRVDTGNNATFRDLLLRVRTACIEAFANPDMPFELLVRKLDFPRDLSRTPLFQAFFSFQDATARNDRLGDLALSQVHVMPDAAPTDLTLWLMQRRDGLVGGLSYSSDLFEAETARTMLEELEVILRAVMTDLDLPVASVPVLSAAERTLLERCHRTDAAYDRGACVGALVARQAVATPHATAVIDEAGREMTYSQLVARAREIEAELVAAGIGRGARVGVFLERSSVLPAVLLGILEAGAAYVPLDPAFPLARLSLVASDAQLACLVTSGSLGASCLPGVRRVEVEPSRPTTTFPAGWQGDDARPDDPAYVIYTSGSTGTPKGVVVPHRAVVNLLSSMTSAPGLTPADAFVAVTTLSFDIAALEIFLPLVCGSRVIIASRETASDGSALLSLLRRVDATALQATPSTWRMLVEAGWSARDGLKKALCGGEALPLDLARAIAERSEEAWNLYGPTETTVWSTAWRLPRQPDRVLIGSPIANTRCHVVDAVGQEVPVGACGELCIGGDGVSLGYLGKPEKTAERFVPDPFARVAEARMYKTGDVVRRLRSGELEYIGRTDHQVKLRGHRIELGEIESRLLGHPAVSESCAAVQSRGGDRYLALYYALRPGQSATITELRRLLRASLPEYMLPQAFVELPALPRTPNGKVDRKALPEPFGDDRVAPGSVLPRTDNERIVARVWCDLVGRREVGVHDNFFDLGGHSLLVLRAIARIAEETGVRLGPRSFVVDTLEQLAAQLPATRAPGAAEKVSTELEVASLLARLRQRLLG